MSVESTSAASLPPKVNGIVLDTTQTEPRGKQLIEVSIGADDGLKMGHELIVYRFGESEEKVYIGRIRLELVTANRAVGIVLERRKGASVEREDRVTTEPL